MQVLRVVRAGEMGRKSLLVEGKGEPGDSHVDNQRRQRAKVPSGICPDWLGTLSSPVYI